MISRMLKVFTLVFCLVPFAKAGGHNFGLGLIVGQPTALSAKYWTSANTALDFGLGWGLGYDRYDNCWDLNYYNNNRGYCNDRGYYYGDHNDRYGYRGLHLHADYLFHNFHVIQSSEKFPIYYGPGVTMDFWNHGGAQIGARGVVGVAWMPRNAPLDVFFELAPVLEIVPGTWFDVNAGLGARFYF